MGALIGLLLGLGALLVWTALTTPRRPAGQAGATPTGRARGVLAANGLDGVRPAALAVGCSASAVAAGLAVALVSRSTYVALAFALPAAWAPIAVLRGRLRRRRAARRDLWPDVVDNLASAIRAGMSLAEALAALGERGPEQLRETFRRFGADYRATGRYDECLDRLKAALADPTGDRVVESLRLARQVGGSDVGRLLRTLSGFLREEARTRAELESRQSWTVNAARLAVAAPWVVLALMSLRPEAVAAYDRPAGAVVLLLGGSVCAAAYRLMVALGRLPVEPRVLAAPDARPGAVQPGRRGRQPFRPLTGQGTAPSPSRPGERAMS